MLCEFEFFSIVELIRLLEFIDLLLQLLVVLLISGSRAGPFHESILLFLGQFLLQLLLNHVPLLLKMLKHDLLDSRKEDICLPI